MQDTEDECLCVSENLRACVYFSMCAPVVYHIVEHFYVDIFNEASKRGPFFLQVDNIIDLILLIYFTFFFFLAEACEI